MQVRAVLLAAALALLPLSARAADLVVWWDKGLYATEDVAVRELVTAFEQKTGKTVELVQHDRDEMRQTVEAALDGGQPPDFFYGTVADVNSRWAFEDRLVDLTEALGLLRDLFDADALDYGTLLNGRTGTRALYGLPMARDTNHLHVWASLLERAGFTLEDIPREWEAFWSFWCDTVQPAVRRATGRDDIWAIGLTMSPKSLDTRVEYQQFQLAYGSPWAGRDGRLRVDDPGVRAGMVRALEAYTGLYKRGCVPPDAVRWDRSIDNNEAFVAQRAVMTANVTLSVTALLREARPDDYLRNAATIDWPNDVQGRPLVIAGGLNRAVVFKDGKNVPLALEFVRFLVADGWLGHWLSSARDAYLPPMRGLLETPFWLDPGDPHRLRSAIQAMSREHNDLVWIRNTDWRAYRVWTQNVWGTAVHPGPTHEISAISAQRVVSEAGTSMQARRTHF
jgi:multiple sugar transport system substrate-binding protein